MDEESEVCGDWNDECFFIAREFENENGRIWVFLHFEV
jgi:hypothetical protein